MSTLYHLSFQVSPDDALSSPAEVESVTYEQIEPDDILFPVDFGDDLLHKQK